MPAASKGGQAIRREASGIYKQITGNESKLESKLDSSQVEENLRQCLRTRWYWLANLDTLGMMGLQERPQMEKVELAFRRNLQ